MHALPLRGRSRVGRPGVYLSLMLFALTSQASAADWTSLGPDRDLAPWQTPHEGWEVVGGVRPGPMEGRLFDASPGAGILYNGPTGRGRNLVSKDLFGDVEVHLVFMVPKGSNSGIKLEGLYEIQIADSWGKKKVTASDCGGVYPRAELLPNYRHIDDGYPPSRNACKKPGEWQTLDVFFRAPRFDASGKKTANARFVKVVLNGQTIHENLDVPYPTGHAWHDTEVPKGPILLQADHGPVAFREVKVRPLDERP